MKSSLSGENLISRVINNLGHLPLEAMSCPPVWSKVITNIVYSNPIPHMLVKLFLVNLHWQAQCQVRESKRGTENSPENLKTKESIKLDAYPNLSWYSLPTKYKGGGP